MRWTERSVCECLERLPDLLEWCERERGTRSRSPSSRNNAASAQHAHVAPTTSRGATQQAQGQVRAAPCLVRQVCADFPSSQRSPPRWNEQRLSRNVQGWSSSVSSRLTDSAVCSYVCPPLPLFLRSFRRSGRLHHNQHRTLLPTDHLYRADTLPSLSTRASASLRCGLSSPRLFSPTPTPLGLSFSSPVFQRLIRRSVRLRFLRTRLTALIKRADPPRFSRSQLSSLPPSSKIAKVFVL